jgi:hypothetical protein
MRLRSDLQAYLEELRDKGAHESDLARAIACQLGGSESRNLNLSALTDKENELESLRQTHAQLVANHTKLRTDHQKLIGNTVLQLHDYDRCIHIVFVAVARELTTALELAAKAGGPGASGSNSKQKNFTWSSIVLKCGRLYPELFSNQTGGGGGSSDKSAGEIRASTAIGNHHSRKNRVPTEVNISGVAVIWHRCNLALL